MPLRKHYDVISYKFASFTIFIYFSLSFRPSLPTETLVALYHDQTKLSPVYLTFIHVYGEAKNFKKIKCLHFNCYIYATDFLQLVQSFALRAEICENQDYRTEIYKQDLGGSGFGQDVTLAVISEKRDNFTVIEGHFHCFEITCQDGHVARQNNTIF